MFNQEFIGQFVEEAREHIDSVESILLMEEGVRDNQESINSLFRAVHSIKGTASFMGLKNIVELSHAMENIFGEIRSGKYSLTETIVDTMLEGNDRIKNLLDNIFESDSMDISDMVLKVQKSNMTSSDDGAKKAAYFTKDLSGSVFNFAKTCNSLIEISKDEKRKFYKLSLKTVGDLLSYLGGPIKLFKKILDAGELIETFTDHSTINSLDDILTIEDDDQKDVILAIFVSSNIEILKLAGLLDIDVEKISEVKVDKVSETAENSNQNTPKKIEIDFGMDQNEGLKVVDDKKEVEEKNEEAKKEVGKGKNEDNSKIDAKNIKINANKIDETVRINASILNELLDMAGEMVLGRNQLLKTLDEYRQDIPNLNAILQNIDRLTSTMQEKIMQARMQPLANVFNKFPRMMRDISHKLSKEIELIIEDSGVELDKSMIEAIGDPLTHLVRNSADHGIELPGVRVEKGKDRKGTIIIRAFQDGGYVNIRVIDDGAGIDVEKLKQKAVEKGLVSIQQAENLDKVQAFDLIFEPGLSTTEKVTDISGRGVGMDVVKTNIEAIGGTIVIDSTLGEGTIITLKIPITLAIIDGMNLTVGGIHYTIPTMNIVESFRPEASDIISDSEGNEMIMLRGVCYPIIRIGRLFNVSGAVEKLEEGIILMVESDETVICIAADELLGEQQVVVKSLPKYLKKVKGVAACTLIGDGTISLILDVVGIMKLHRETKMRISE